MTAAPPTNLSRSGSILAAVVRAVTRRPVGVLLVGVIAAAALGLFAARRLGVDTDTSGMFSKDVPYRQHLERFYGAFPQFRDSLLVVVEGDDAGRAERATRRLAERLAKDELFHSVYAAEADPFLREHGLLFLSTEELSALASDLGRLAPWLAYLAGEPTLARVAESLTGALTLARDSLPRKMDTVLAALHQTVAAERAGESRPIPWLELLTGPERAGGRRRVFLTQPSLDFTRFLPAEQAIQRVRDVALELSLTPEHGVRIGFTGEVALNHEELQLTRDGIVFTSIVAFVLISIILALGLRSVRLVVASLVSLGIGLAWTAGFAALTVGDLNLISVAFTVLYVSLGVDFAIHFALRALELTEGGTPWLQALEDASKDVGSSLFVAALTTACGFLAFVPTEFEGVAELGIIASGGVLLSFVASLTVFPALIALERLRPSRARRAPTQAETAPGAAALPALLRSRTAIRVATLVVLLAATFVLRGVRFESDPLHLRDPESESVRLFRALAEDPLATPYRANVLARDEREAGRLLGELGALEGVAFAVAAESFVPEDQDAKRAVLAELASVLPAEVGATPPTEATRLVEALTGLREALVGSTASETATGLAEELSAYLSAVDGLGADARSESLGSLDASAVDGLAGALSRLVSGVRVGPVTGVPDSVAGMWVGAEGVRRVEAVPLDAEPGAEALRPFVAEVRTVAPEATGAPFSIADTGVLAVRSFQRAFSFAFLAVAVVLGVLLRRVWDVVLLLSLLLLAGVLTAAATVVFGIDFNFANVIALPVLLGMGVDNGVHMIHRWREGAGAGGNLLATSTARAVLFSSLTTVGGFGTLALSPHPGTASIGVVLSIGIGATLLCTMVVLPAVLPTGRGVEVGQR